MNTASSKIKKKIGVSSLWQIGGSISQAVIRLGASTILARKLAPEDFGIFGLAIISRELIVTIGNVGVGSAIIAQKDVNDEDLSTCFWTIAGVNFILFLIGFVSAPLFAYFYKEPQLTNLFRFVLVSLIISIIGTTSQIILRRKLELSFLSIVRTLGVLLESSIAIFLVCNTNLRFWSLAIAMTVAAVISEFVILLYAKWLPKFTFNVESFKFIFNFGFKVQGFSIMNYFSQNVDYIIVGRSIGMNSLGLYEFAYRIPHLILERLATPLGAVIFPSLSLFQDNSKKFFEYYIAFTKSILYLTLPFLILLVLVTHPLVSLLWGDKWLPIVIPLQILCFAAIIKCLMVPLNSVFYCKQRPDIPFKISIIRLCLAAMLVYFLGNYFSLKGVAVAMLLSTFPSFFGLFLALRLMNVSFFSFLSKISPTIIPCLLASIVIIVIKQVNFFQNLAEYVYLLLSIFTFLITFIICLRYLFPDSFWEIRKNMLLLFNKKG